MLVNSQMVAVYGGLEVSFPQMVRETIGGGGQYALDYRQSDLGYPYRGPTRIAINKRLWFQRDGMA